MRDSLKDIAYFEAYKLKIEGIIESSFLWIENKEISEERIPITKDGIRSDFLKLAIVSYSKGDKINITRDFYLKSIALLKEGWQGTGSWKLVNDEGEFDQYTFTGFYYMLDMLSLGYLLDIPDDKFQLLVDVIDRDGVKDKVFEFIISAKLPNRKPIESESYQKYFGVPETFSKFRELIDEKDKSTLGKLVKDYLSKHWYKQHKETGLKDNHKSKHDAYYGYWSFETAAIVKIMGLDDSTFIDNKYYPKDLVHQAKEEPKKKGFLGKLRF